MQLSLDCADVGGGCTLQHARLSCLQISKILLVMNIVLLALFLSIMFT